VLYTEGWVCDVALIEYTLGPGKPKKGGILEGRVQGANGGQRELVYEQPGTEEDDSTAGGCQVSKEGISKGNLQQGECAMYSCIL
jgi:hypothetical protein